MRAFKISSKSPSPFTSEFANLSLLFIRLKSTKRKILTRSSLERFSKTHLANPLLLFGLFVFPVEILLSSEVVTVEHDQKRVTAVVVKRKTGAKKLVIQEVISSIPISDFIQSLNQVVPSEIARTNHKLTYRDELQVAIFINKTHLTADTWIYVHSLDLPYVRFMEMDNWSDKLSPEGTTTLVFEIACNEGDQTWRQTDLQIVDLVVSAFIKAFNLITARLMQIMLRMIKPFPL